MKQFYRICLTTGAIALFFCTAVRAQQEAMYTQYMFNGLAINPAYAGSHETLSLTALMRNQWSGLEGAPVTQTFSAHSPIINKRIGLGLLLVHDKIGVTEQTDFKVAYSYRIPMRKKDNYFSFGIQGGLMYFNAKYSKINSNDPAFANDVTSYKPSTGVGVYYYSKQFYLGLSVPELLRQSVDNKASVTRVSHFYLSSGYVFDLSSVVKFKPNILVKMVSGAPIEMDLNANFLFHEVVWAGLSWRSFDSIDALFQINITRQLQVGYSYDFLTSSQIKTIKTSTHELMINLRLGAGKTKITTPRYF